MLPNLSSIVDQFTPDILGVFWISNEELSLDLLGFDEFNYLFDGLLSQYLYGQKDNEINPDLNKANVFFTHNFNQKLFLAHIKMNAEIDSIMDKHLALIPENEKSEKSERKKILIFNKSSKPVGSNLEKRYPQFEFKSLELA